MTRWLLVALALRVAGLLTCWLVSWIFCWLGGLRSSRLACMSGSWLDCSSSGLTGSPQLEWVIVTWLPPCGLAGLLPVTGCAVWLGRWGCHDRRVPLSVCRSRERQGEIGTAAALLSVVDSHSAPTLQMGHLKQSRTTLRIRHNSPKATAASGAVCRLEVLRGVLWSPLGCRFLVPPFFFLTSAPKCVTVAKIGLEGYTTCTFLRTTHLFRTPAPKCMKCLPEYVTRDSNMGLLRAGSTPESPVWGHLRRQKQLLLSLVESCKRMECGGLVWSGLVWSGLVWSGLVWSGLVWSGLVWSGLVWSGLVWSGLVWSGLVWSGLVWSGLGGMVTLMQKFQ